MFYHLLAKEVNQELTDESLIMGMIAVQRDAQNILGGKINLVFTSF